MHNNDIIHKKALKSVSSVLKEFSQIANIEPKLTTYGTKGVGNLEMSSVSMISHEERLLPQCFSANDIIIKRVYTAFSESTDNQQDTSVTASCTCCICCFTTFLGKFDATFIIWEMLNIYIFDRVFSNPNKCGENPQDHVWESSFLKPEVSGTTRHFKLFITWSDEKLMSKGLTSISTSFSWIKLCPFLL